MLGLVREWSESEKVKRCLLEGFGWLSDCYGKGEMVGVWDEVRKDKRLWEKVGEEGEGRY